MADLMYSIPVLRNIRIFNKYSEYLHSIDFKVDPLLWIVSSAVISMLFGLGTWYAIDLFVGMPEAPQIGVLALLVAADVLIGLPFFKAMQRIEKIEEDLPDALKQMSDTLRSGGTYEYALREVANSELGPLKKEIQGVLRKLEEGENFETALKTLAANVDSRIVKRTVTIIIDSVAAGAGLASVLDEIAEDVRDAHRIDKERKSNTMLQVIFMFTAGALIAPMILGFVSTISKLLITSSAIAVEKEQIEIAQNAANIIQLSIQGYIFIETVATSVMMSVMREGKVSKSIIYIPILLCIAYISYLVAGIISGVMIGVGT